MEDWKLKNVMDKVQGMCDEVRKREGYEKYCEVLGKYQDDFYNSTAFEDNPSDDI